MTTPALQPVAEFMVEWHYAAAYLGAAAFPTLRFARRKLLGMKTSMDSIMHQAATGFVMPAFFMLCASYSVPSLLAQLSPHELGLAGLFALLTSVRELFVDGVERDPDSTTFGSKSW